MDGFDKEIKRLKIGVSLLALSHIEYLKSKGKIGSSLWGTVQEWETEKLASLDSEQSILIAILFEACILETISKIFEQEVEQSNSTRQGQN